MIDINKIKSERDKYFAGELEIFGANGVVYFAEHIATLARNDALEEAAKYINDLPFVNDSVAIKIRALKDKEVK